VRQKNGLRPIDSSGALLLQQAFCGNSSNNKLFDVEVFGQAFIKASKQISFSIGTPLESPIFIFFLSLELEDLLSSRAIG
jgi:hypothetical protein